MPNSKKIAFLQVAHLPDDDRVWFHQSKALKDNGYEVFVISTRTEYSDLKNLFCFDDTGMKKSAVSKKISEILKDIHPTIIICDNPLSVFFASKYKKKHNHIVKIVMDITEWYPSKKNLANLRGIKYFIKKIALKVLNYYSGRLVDGFIFGETYKAQFFKQYFKKKPSVDLPYYPDLRYFNKYSPKSDFSTWNLLYGGLLNKDKGFYNVIESVKIAALENQTHKFILNIISNDILNEEQRLIIEDIPDNLNIKFYPFLPFETFCKEIANYDIFLDLREKDTENNRCLPIKLFYYMACGKPSIFSDLDAIKTHIPEINEFACLTNPKDYHHIAQTITAYIKNKDKYLTHCEAAIKFSNEKYNWEKLLNNFLKFIEDTIH